MWNDNDCIYTRENMLYPYKGGDRPIVTAGNNAVWWERRNTKPW